MDSSSSCRNADARCIAARLVASYLARSARTAPAFIYGTESAVTVGLGKIESWSSAAAAPKAKCPWGGLNAFTEAHPDRYIFGYVGFDIHYHDQPHTCPLSYPAAHLVVPECVVQVSAAGLRILVGNATLAQAAASSATPCRCRQLKTLSAVTFDTMPEPLYWQAVQSALDWIDGDAQRRLTVARRVTCTLPLDILNSVYSAPSGSAISRSFYVHTADIEIAGHSPELLATGDARQFHSYKLSGTYPRADNLHVDAQLREAFIHDPKIVNEHASSVSSAAAALRGMGNVTQGAPAVLDLPLIRHMMTAFEINTTEPKTVADCLRSVMPTGAYPLHEGLVALRTIETQARGAYYGLLGLIEPGRTFSFSQILRSVFRDRHDTHVWVGAAVTPDSEPTSEYAETRLKLASIQLALML